MKKRKTTKSELIEGVTFREPTDLFVKKVRMESFEHRIVVNDKKISVINPKKPLWY